MPPAFVFELMSDAMLASAASPKHLEVSPSTAGSCGSGAT